MSEEAPGSPAIKITAHQFYDRQRRAVGAKCMAMLSKAKILICGMTGLGVEIAKNVILTGPNTVFLFDPELVKFCDLSTNFYGKVSDVTGSINRVDAAFPELKELNPYVHVEKVETQPDLAWMQSNGVTVFVMVNMPLNEEMITLEEQVRSVGIKFVSASIRGLCGQLFVDVGENFAIYDSNGEPPAENMVIDVTPIEPEPEKEPEAEAEPAEAEVKGEEEAEVKEEEPEEIPEPDLRAQMLVSVFDDKINHGLGNGDKVVFSEVPGMPKLVELGSIEEEEGETEEGEEKKPAGLDVEPVGRHTFKIFLPDGVTHEDVGVYEKGQMGYCKQVKGEVLVTHQSLKEQMPAPTCLDYDFAKFGYPQKKLHPLFRALTEFMAAHEGALPKSYDEADAAALLELAKPFAGEMEEEELKSFTEFANKFAYTARGDLNPMAAFFGGFAAQEVQVVATGKYTPLQQWFYFDAFECLPDPLPTAEDCVVPENSRYEGQIVVFGNTFHQKIQKLKVFLVGAGALGCEYLKNFALMGIATDAPKEGVLTVTDMDVVETSNLNRQFLFRQRHIQKMKSISAAETVKGMNPEFNIVPHEIRVGPATEDFFNQAFWAGLDVVVNALDNVQARLYVDSKIVEAKVPLIEAGTTGPQANCQIIVPMMTESYGDQRDPPEKRAPACTLKNFPYQITHCITWARDAFEKIYKNRPLDVNTYLDNANYLNEIPGTTSARLDVIKAIYDHITNRPENFHDCVEWARLRFADFFQNNIVQLLHSFPADYVDPKTSRPFWTGSKRCPKPAMFSFENELHREFMISASNLCAEMFGIKLEGREFDFVGSLARIAVPEFTPSSSVKLQVDEEDDGEEEVEEDDTEAAELAELIAKMPAPDAALRMNPITFEKDDDTNFHVDFMTATSNCRGENYIIPPANKDKTKGIAGRIIPAMVTSTSMITGIGCLELYKVIQPEGTKKKEDYKNTFMTLALPALYQSEPADPKKLPGENCTKWDAMTLTFGKDVTVRELCEHFKTKHNATVDSIGYRGSMSYCTYLPGYATDERLDILVSEAQFKYCSDENRPNEEAIQQMKYLYLAVLFEDDVLEIPALAYQFRQF